MTNYTKPSNNGVNKVWATTAPTTNVQAPDDSYINLGWTQVKPPSEYFNWWMKKVDTLLAYNNQKGIPEWDANTEYQANTSFVQYGGQIWLAVNTNTNSAPSESNGNWKNYLKGLATQTYTDTSVNNLKNSLHKVATTGLASDLQGYLPWLQLSDVPEWIRETHTDNGQLYMRSPDGTQYRLGNNRLDFFNGDKIIFGVNPEGILDHGYVPWDLIEGKPILGDSSPLNTDKAEWDGVGDTKETVITAHQLYGLRENAVLRDNITKAGLSGGDITRPYFKSGSGVDVSLARLEYVDALNTNMDNAKITRDNVTIAGFVNGNKFDPYFRHSSDEVVPLARLAYLEETKKALNDGKVDRDNITTAGFLSGDKSSPYMSGPAGQTLLQERATSGSTETNGTITFPNVITMQYGSYNYPDITTVGTFTIPFNEPWARIMCVLITVDSGQDVTAVTLNVTSSNFQVRIREWYNGTFGGTIRWLALGFK